MTWVKERIMTDRLTLLEETVAHLGRTVDDLSEVIARQDGEIATLTRRLAMLIEREAERQADQGSEIPLADQRPPHW
jgi:SlyX protein